MDKRHIIFFMFFLFSSLSTHDITFYDAPLFFNGRYENPSSRPFKKKTYFDVVHHGIMAIGRSLKSHFQYFFKQPFYAFQPYEYDTLEFSQATNMCEIIPLGHATVLVSFKLESSGNKDYFRIMIDPVFSDLENHFLGRYAKCAIKKESLPPIDLILISHNHLDECDLPSIRYLINKNPNIVVCMPKGNAKVIYDGLRCDIDPSHLKELTWWEIFEFNKKTGPFLIDLPSEKIKITLVPTKHFSGRSFFGSDENEALWGGYVIEACEKKIVYISDSGYGDHFHAIQNKFSNFDALLLCVGPAEPKNLFEDCLLTGKEAYQVFLDLGRPNYTIPLHWGVFKIGSDGITSQKDEFVRLMLANAPQKLFGQQIGEKIYI